MVVWLVGCFICYCFYNYMQVDTVISCSGMNKGFCILYCPVQFLFLMCRLLSVTARNKVRKILPSKPLPYLMCFLLPVHARKSEEYLVH